MGCSWLAVQNPHDILSGGDCSDGEREGKSQLFESGHAENDSTAEGKKRPGRLARRDGPRIARSRDPGRRIFDSLPRVVTGTTDRSSPRTD